MEANHMFGSIENKHLQACLIEFGDPNPPECLSLAGRDQIDVPLWPTWPILEFPSLGSPKPVAALARPFSPLESSRVGTPWPYQLWLSSATFKDPPFLFPGFSAATES